MTERKQNEVGKCSGTRAASKGRGLRNRPRDNTLFSSFRTSKQAKNTIIKHAAKKSEKKGFKHAETESALGAALREAGL